MRSSSLPSLFLTIALATLAEGCSDDSIDTSRFTADVCTGGLWKPLQNIKPAAGIDGVELRSASWQTPETPTVVDSFGAICSGAKDQPACKAALDALHDPEKGWMPYTIQVPMQRQYLVSTSRDTIALHASVADARAVFGTIDTPNEAAFIATIANEHRIQCGKSANVRSDGSIELLTETGTGCGKGDDRERHVVVVQPDGTVSVTETELLESGDPNCAIGRRTEGLVPCAAGDESMGSFFAKMAHLEAAAVPAFERLVRELTAHGAPRALIVAARRAARDEVRHARAVAKLAARFGATPEPVVMGEMPMRSLEEIARENATEGCVRETFGALVATYQARAARDPQIAKVMRGIARDETMHAQLSWEVAEWARARLDADARVRIDNAVMSAVAELRNDLATPACREAIELAGFPNRESAIALFDQLAPQLWAA